MGNRHRRDAPNVSRPARPNQTLYYTNAKQKLLRCSLAIQPRTDSKSINAWHTGLEFRNSNYVLFAPFREIPHRKIVLCETFHWTSLFIGDERGELKIPSMMERESHGAACLKNKTCCHL